MTYAYAQAAGATQGPSAFEAMVPFILIFGIFYFLLIRPQAKQRKLHHKFLSEMKRGDEVVTASGVLGRVEGITDKIVVLEVADNTKIKVLKYKISGPFKKENM